MSGIATNSTKSQAARPDLTGTFDNSTTNGLPPRGNNSQEQEGAQAKAQEGAQEGKGGKKRRKTKRTKTSKKKSRKSKKRSKR